MSACPYVRRLRKRTRRMGRIRWERRSRRMGKTRRRRRRRRRSIDPVESHKGLTQE